MRAKLVVIAALAIFSSGQAGSDSSGALDYSLAISLEDARLDDLSLGSDPAEERLREQNYEFEFDLNYQVNDRLYLFFGGSLIDETTTTRPSGRKTTVSGFERQTLGASLSFGEAVASEFGVGRMEFSSLSEWWLWWDDDLDAIRLESDYEDLSAMLGIARELARESTGEDFIDPRAKNVTRVIASLGWELTEDQSLGFYYLEQDDGSGVQVPGEVIESDRIDSEDADLAWSGISYLAEFASESLGEVELELHLARVSGHETTYQFVELSTGLSQVTLRSENRVSGRAQGYLLNWTPSVLDAWSLVVGHAWGSGDDSPGDGHNRAFRETGLQGDTEVFGELFQPELSNLVVDLVGVEWRVHPRIDLGLFHYDYRQQKAAGSMRDVGIKLDPDGTHRDLGREIDLVVAIDADKVLAIVLTAARFKAGSAYAIQQGETSRYVNFELSYEF